MGYKLIETRLASQDLDNILEYMAVRLQNPAAASAFADAVEQCYDLLENTPLMYEPAGICGCAQKGIGRL